MIVLYVLLVIMINQENSFKDEQLRYSRVRNAYSEKGDFIQSKFDEYALSKEEIKLFIRAFKDTETLEVWAGVSGSSYKKILEYPFCSISGNLGPKRMQGDSQIPEGFYYIDRFNPASNFYLSLGLNYPNRADRIHGDPLSPGGDIFIHGSCVTIGCIPITDEKIMELYILAVEARNNGQDKIPVHIFPSRLDDESMNSLNQQINDEKLSDFWKGLSAGYMFFERNLKPPEVGITANGDYFIK